MQRQMNATVDQLRPQRWNWSALIQPLDRNLMQQADRPLAGERLVGLRYFWLDGLFSATSESFYLGFVPLFALAYGASNGQIGWLTAVANLWGAFALFPGARLVEWAGRRKPVVVWSAGGIGRLALLGLACFPFFITQPVLAIGAIVLLNGLRTFMANLANPAWTSLVADLVPDSMRGRYFGSRNMAMGLAALFGQRMFGRLLDQKGAFWVQTVTGLLIPGLPLAWVFITAPWQVSFINVFGGLLWAGYNLSNFNLLLRWTPEEQRPRAVALFQTAVFSSAVLGPLLGGYLADAISFKLIFALSGGGRLLGMLILLRYWWRYRSYSATRVTHST